MSLKSIAVIAGVLGLLFIAFLVFSPLMNMTENLTPTLVTSVTDNDTAYASDNGTVPVFNDVKSGLTANYIWIIIVVVIIAAVIAISVGTKGEQ
jgi:hypothetical protein